MEMNETNMEEGTKKRRKQEEKEGKEEEWTIDSLLGFGKFHYFQVWVIQTVIAFLGRLTASK
jgi:hypothetical protein